MRASCWFLCLQKSAITFGEGCMLVKGTPGILTHICQYIEKNMLKCEIYCHVYIWGRQRALDTCLLVSRCRDMLSIQMARCFEIYLSEILRTECAHDPLSCFSGNDLLHKFVLGLGFFTVKPSPWDPYTSHWGRRGRTRGAQLVVKSNSPCGELWPLKLSWFQWNSNDRIAWKIVLFSLDKIALYCVKIGPIF